MCLLVVEVGVQKILGSIDQLRSRVDGSDQDIQFLSDLLASNQLQSLVKVPTVTPITASFTHHFSSQVERSACCVCLSVLTFDLDMVGMVVHLDLSMSSSKFKVTCRSSSSQK